MNSALIEKISRTYDKHPLKAATILDRIRRNVETTGISELDLATDEETLITDQNHTGGLYGVIELAQSVGIQGGERVLDVGTGLGGTPRVLAHLYGCLCHGVELTTSRYCDAIELTRLVGLQNLVTFSCGDFLSIEVPGSPFDVVIGQDTFMHFPDLQSVVDKCSMLLREEGWLVVEDGYIRREPANDLEKQQIASAWNHWNGRFHPLAEWQHVVHQSGFHIRATQDLTTAALREYEDRLERTKQADPPIEPHERAGWHLGEELIRGGVIGMIRLLCQMPARTGQP